MSRTNEAWRGGLAGVGDAMLDRGATSFDGQTASGPHSCHDRRFMPALLVGKNDTRGHEWPLART